MGLFSGVGKWFFGDEKQDLRRLLEHDYGAKNVITGLAGEQARLREDPSRSISGRMLQQGLQQNVAAQSSLAAGAPAGQQAAARRMAQQQAGKMGSELVGQQSLAAALEAERLRKLQLGLMMQLRGQDLGMWAQQMQRPTAAEQGLGIVKGAAGMLGLS